MRPIHSQEELFAKAKAIKAFIFDWDGVFNGGFKNLDGGSPFSEVGSMGVKMLRYASHLKNGSLPPTAIISGRKNPYADHFAQREHLNGVYMGYSDKQKAFAHFCDTNGVGPHEVAFVFDDILDLNVAAQAGLRVMIGNPATTVLQELVIKRNEVDAITSASGADNGLREACEFIIGLFGNFEEVVETRSKFNDDYSTYLAARNAVQPMIQVNGS